MNRLLADEEQVQRIAEKLPGEHNLYSMLNLLEEMVDLGLHMQLDEIPLTDDEWDERMAQAEEAQDRQELGWAWKPENAR